MFTASTANAEFLGGFFYNGCSTPGGGYTSVAPTRQGTSICKNFWYLFSTGDCSVRTAMKNGGIRTLSGYDVQRENVLGFQTINYRNKNRRHF